VESGPEEERGEEKRNGSLRNREETAGKLLASRPFAGSNRVGLDAQIISGAW